MEEIDKHEDFYNFLASLTEEEENKFYSKSSATSQYNYLNKLVDRKEEDEEKRERIKASCFWLLFCKMKQEEHKNF